MAPETAEAADRVGGSQSHQAYISLSPKATTASSPQAGRETGGLPRLPLGPHSQTEDRHLDTFHQKRRPAQTDWHEPHVTQELRRKAEQRDQAVNQAQGSALEEAAQQVREEIKGATPKAGCPGQAPANPAPFSEAPASSTEPSNKASGDSLGMDHS